MSAKLKFRSLISRLGILIFVVLFAQACATNPVTGKRELALSENWEVSAGAKYHQEILKQYQIYEDPELQEYVDDIGQRLAAKSHRPDLKFTFTLLDSPQVNAFALPGGYVYVTRGIMSYMNREAHLAGVIGHEIGHVTGRHGAQRAAQQQVAGIASAAVAIGTGNSQLAQMSQMLGGALLKGYGRTQELESDRLGAEYIAKNNYDPEDMIGVIGILKNQELFNAEKARSEGKEPQAYHGVFASHPRNDQRLQQVILAAEKFRDASQPVADDGRFLRLTNGMSFGESEGQGITRNNKFYHKALDLYMEFPQGWRVVNQPTALIGVSSDGAQIIRMQMASATNGVAPSQYLASNFQGFREGRQISTTEGEAYAGVATLSDKRTGQKQNVRVSAIHRNGQAFVMLGQGKTQLPNQSFFDTVTSVRRLKRNEQELASGSNIKLVTVKRGDTFAKLAAKSSLSSYAEAQLRLINNMYPTGEPIPGQQIKIIQ
jgi:predicted Zn-dependent protease